jgi:hypothetical protein
MTDGGKQMDVVVAVADPDRFFGRDAELVKNLTDAMLLGGIIIGDLDSVAAVPIGRGLADNALNMTEGLQDGRYTCNSSRYG